MTIKNTDKNISAENEEIVKDIDLQPNGTLKITKKNLYTDSTTEADDSKYLDLKNIKLRLVRISQRDLDNLAISNNEQDIVLKETNIFLVPLDDHETDDADEYKEMIWSSDKEAFEKIGTTRLDLDTKANIDGGVQQITDGNAHTTIGSSANDTQGVINTKIDSKLDSIEDKADSVHNALHSLENSLANVAISGNYDDLNNKPAALDISGKENTSNKSQSISTDSQSTTKYPSVKAVEDYTSTTYATKTELNNAQIDSSNVDLTGYLSIADAEKSYIKKQNGTQFSLEYADMENEYDERYYENHGRHITGDEGVLYGVNLEEEITYLGYTREHNSNYLTFKVDKSDEGDPFNELCEIYYFKDIAIYTVSTDYLVNYFAQDIYDLEDIESDSNFNYIGLLNYHEDVILGKNLANVAWSGDYNDLENKPTIPDISGKANSADLANIATTGSYADLEGITTEELEITYDDNGTDVTETITFLILDDS